MNRKPIFGLFAAVAVAILLSGCDDRAKSGGVETLRQPNVLIDVDVLPAAGGAEQQSD